MPEIIKSHLGFMNTGINKAVFENSFPSSCGKYYKYIYIYILFHKLEIIPVLDLNAV